jgi:hypothetical protein
VGWRRPVGLPRIDNTETGAEDYSSAVNLARAANPDLRPGKKKGYKLGSALFAFFPDPSIERRDGVGGAPGAREQREGGSGGWRCAAVPLRCEREASGELGEAHKSCPRANLPCSIGGYI